MARIAGRDVHRCSTRDFCCESLILTERPRLPHRRQHRSASVFSRRHIEGSQAAVRARRVGAQKRPRTQCVPRWRSAPASAPAATPASHYHPKALGPTLAGAVFQVDAARDLVGHEPRADAVLTELRRTLQDAVAGIRALVYALRPPALDELGLLPALREQANALNGNGFLITVDGPSQLPQLPAAVEVAAYRIAAEALTNAVRHSAAHTCSVRSAVDGDLDIEVTDDGIGYRPERVGVGIASMRERAGEIGATLTIGPGPAGGTRVHTRLPLERG